MPRLLHALGALVLVLLGAALAVVMMKASGMTPTPAAQLSYADFTGIILSALGVILGALAVFLGAIAFVGWATFEAMVERRANKYLEQRFSPEDDRYVQLVQELKEDVRREISLRSHKPASEEVENKSPYDEAAV